MTFEEEEEEELDEKYNLNTNSCDSYLNQLPSIIKRPNTSIRSDSNLNEKNNIRNSFNKSQSYSYNSSFNRTEKDDFNELYDNILFKMFFNCFF